MQERSSAVADWVMVAGCGGQGDVQAGSVDWAEEKQNAMGWWDHGESRAAGRDTRVQTWAWPETCADHIYHNRHAEKEQAELRKTCGPADVQAEEEC